MYDNFIKLRKLNNNLSSEIEILHKKLVSIDTGFKIIVKAGSEGIVSDYPICTIQIINLNRPIATYEIGSELKLHLSYFDYNELNSNGEQENVKNRIKQIENILKNSLKSTRLISYPQYIELDINILYLEDLELKEKHGFETLEIENLEENCFYYGDCRNSDLAFWKNKQFYYIRTKFQDKYVESINHINKEESEIIDVFRPLSKVENVPDSIKIFILKRL